MNKFKKGISLLAVIAFLITALVPVASLAAVADGDPPEVSVTKPEADPAPLYAVGQPFEIAAEAEVGNAGDTVQRFLWAFTDDASAVAESNIEALAGKYTTSPETSDAADKADTPQTFEGSAWATFKEAVDEAYAAAKVTYKLNGSSSTATSDEYVEGDNQITVVKFGPSPDNPAVFAAADLPLALYPAWLDEAGAAGTGPTATFWWEPMPQGVTAASDAPVGQSAAAADPKLQIDEAEPGTYTFVCHAAGLTDPAGKAVDIKTQVTLTVTGGASGTEPTFAEGYTAVLGKNQPQGLETTLAAGGAYGQTSPAINLDLYPDSSLTLTAVGTNGKPFKPAVGTLQWQSSNDGRYWNNISGATASSYTIAGISAAMQGRQYRVVVVQNGAILTPEAPAAYYPVILNLTGAPGGDVVPQAVLYANAQLTAPGAATTGTFVNFRTYATPTSATFTYAWDQSDNGTDWTRIAGASGPVLTQVVGEATEGKYYRCVATGTMPGGYPATAISNAQKMPSSSGPANGTVSMYVNLPANAQLTQVTDGGSPPVAMNTVVPVQVPSGDKASMGVLATADNMQPVSYSWYTAGKDTNLTTAPVTASAILASGSVWKLLDGSGSSYTTPKAQGSSDTGTYYVCIAQNTSPTANGSTGDGITQLASPIFQIAVGQAAPSNASINWTSPSEAYLQLSGNQVTCVAGSNQTLAVQATGSSTYSYQWEVSQTGASWDEMRQNMEPSVTLTNVTESLNGVHYRCRITDNATQDVAYSTEVVLQVVPHTALPVITEEPADSTGTAGPGASPIVLEGAVTPPRSGVYEYQWYYSESENGTNPTAMGGGYIQATSTGDLELSIPLDTNAPGSTPKSGYYCFVVKNMSSSPSATVSSRWAAVNLTIPNMPVIVSQPENVTAAAGTKAKFSVTATMNVPEGQTQDPVTFTWQMKQGSGASSSWLPVHEEQGTVETDGLTSTLTTTAVTPEMSGYQYRCVVQNETKADDPAADAYTATSSAAVLTVVEGLPQVPEITEQPEDAEAAPGEEVTFSVSAEMTNVPESDEAQTLGFEWQVCTDADAEEPEWAAVTEEDGTVTSEDGTSTLTVTTEEDMDGFQYRCIVTNADDESVEGVVSDAAVLTVSSEPGPGPEEPAIEPAEGSDVAVEDGTLSGTGLTASKEGTTAAELFGMLEEPAEGYELRVESADGEPLEEGDVVATGDQLLLVDTQTGDVVEALDIVVRGDVMGTGIMSLTQLVQMAEAYTGTRELSPLQQKAADLDGNGRITLTDLVQEAALYRADVLDEE